MFVSTIHSLAYNRISAYQYKLVQDLKIAILEKVICGFEQITHQKQYYPTPEYLTLLKDLVNFYCNSSLIALDSKLLNTYKKQSDLDAKILELLNNEKRF